MSTVTKISPALNGLVEAIKKAVYEHAGQISVAEAVGAIEIAKLELLREQEK